MRVAVLLAFAVCYAALPPKVTQTPGEAAAELFHDADTNSDGELHLMEMVQLFDRYDVNGDHKVTRGEYVNYTRHHEPDLVNMAKELYTVFDHDGDHTLQVSDFMHLFLLMNPNVTSDVVTEYTFIGYFTVLYTNLQSN
ncbi:uncharacterized protein [Littorina saxatilis]|uniref:EF-hand domain-containing protein n=1 Tax=Littorina saxatilis TaxID=31220 RepID=A0AAN9G525_9CAEN